MARRTGGGFADSHAQKKYLPAMSATASEPRLTMSDNNQHMVRCPLKRAETLERLEALRPADLQRLKSFARFLSATLDNESDHDLLYEAIDRVLSERRTWSSNREATTLLKGIMKSIADEWRKKRKREMPESQLASAEETEDVGLVAGHRDPSADTEMLVRFGEILRFIEEVFREDEAVTAILMGRCEGLSLAETQDMFNLSPTQYDSALKKLRRAVLAGRFDELRHA